MSSDSDAEVMCLGVLQSQQGVLWVITTMWVSVFEYKAGRARRREGVSDVDTEGSVWVRSRKEHVLESNFCFACLPLYLFAL